MRRRAVAAGAAVQFRLLRRCGEILHGLDRGVHRTTTGIGDDAMRATGTRSFCMLNGNLGHNVTFDAYVRVTASQV